MAKPIVGYWNIRGLAQPIRLLLAYTGTAIEDKRYNVIGPELDRREWESEKFSHGFEFPNLPYYKDNDVKLTQSSVIMKYLARKHGLVARNESEQIRVDYTEAEAQDMRMAWAYLCYGPDFEKNKPGYFQRLHAKLKELSSFLSTHHYFAGDHITYVDFIVYELFDAINHLEPGFLNGYPNLKAYHARIEGLDRIAAYIKSDQFLAGPLNGATASFGNK